MAALEARHRFAGMSYRQASEEAERLLKRALASGSWFDLPDQLVALRWIMDRRQAGRSPETDEAASPT